MTNREIVSINLNELNIEDITCHEEQKIPSTCIEGEEGVSCFNTGTLQSNSVIHLLLLRHSPNKHYF